MRSGATSDVTMNDPKTDGIEELERQQAAQEFEIPDRPPPADFFGAAVDPFADRAGPARGHERVGEAKSLEDLFVIYPDLGRGDWKLRVARTFPRSFRGCSTAGYLGDFYERMSMDEFTVRFGGGRYVLAVMKPVSSGDSVSKSDYKQVKEIHIVVPGDPSMTGIPNANEDDMNVESRFIGRPSEAVEIERMRVEQKALEREREDRISLQNKLDRERDRANQLPAHHSELLNETTRRAFDDLKEHSATQLTFWQQEVERLRAELNVAQAELKDVRQQLIRAESDAANTTRNIETTAMREMRERFDERYSEMKERTDDDRRRMLEEHSRKLEEGEREHRRQIEELTSRHAEERRTYESNQALERERVREDMRVRVEAVEKARENEVSSLRSTYESRLEDLRRSTEREVETIRDQSRREVDSVKVSEKSTATLTTETANMRLALMEGEMLRLRAEVSEQRVENNRLRDELVRQQAAQHKDPLTALTEAREMAAMTGMVEAAEVSGSEDWKDKAIAIGQKLVENAPQIMEQVTKARDGNRAQVQQQQYMQQQQQRRVVQQQQPPPQAGRYAPPALAPRMAPAQNAYSPPLPLGGMTMAMGAPLPLAPAVVSMASPLQPHEHGSAPIGMSEDVARGQEEVGAAPPPTIQDPAQQRQQQPQAQVSLGALPPQAVGEFFQSLENAVRERVIPPEMFAEGFISRVGPEVAAAVAQQVSAEQIIETARQATDGQSRIVTRDGQRYVQQMWQHVAQALQQPRSAA